MLKPIGQSLTSLIGNRIRKEEQRLEILGQKLTFFVDNFIKIDFFKENKLKINFKGLENVLMILKLRPQHENFNSA